MLSIGFTGTRNGMTDRQRASLLIELHVAIEICKPWTARHGMCLGSDEEFHGILRPFANGTIHGHPCDIAAMWAPIYDCDVVHAPKRPLVRNRDIVTPSTLIFAAPAEDVEQQRGGTWATIRMARKAGKQLAIVMPDGRVVKERWV